MNILRYYHGHKWGPSFYKLIVEEYEEEDILRLEIAFSNINLNYKQEIERGLLKIYSM
jgi:hypothetical protein